MPRQSSTTSQRIKSAAADQAKQLARDWFTLTFVTDRQRLIGPVTPIMLNWAVAIGVSVTIYLAGISTTPLYLVGGWLLVTLVRAHAVQTKRRKMIARIFTTLAPQAKLPTGSMSAPTNPAEHIRKIRWGVGARPERFQVSVTTAAPAATAPLLRIDVEAAIDQLPHAHTKRRGEWIYDWNAATVTAIAVAGGDPRLSRKTFHRRIAGLIKQIFALTRTTAAGWSVDVTGWDIADTATGQAEYPTHVTIQCGDRDVTDPALRDKVERHFERAVTTPGEWIFDWNLDTSSLSITNVDPNSLDAHRKRTQRRLSDDLNALVVRPGKDPIIVEVTEWLAPDGQDSDLPGALHVQFGTLALDDPRRRDSLEDGFDAAVKNRWHEARALFDWQHGAVTELDITLVAATDPRALQRVALTRFRSVVDAKFGTSKNPVLTEVLDWQATLTAAGTALPQVARVVFGTVDVTKADTRDAFQDHWDSIDDNNDWHYEWNTAGGYVEMTAVPRLATAIAYPNPGEPEHDLLVRRFHEGKIVIGPQKGGGQFVWDLNKIAHGLIGGRTGSGKSVLLDAILNLILLCREVADLVVCDPKMTDFTWTPEFPNVIRFAAGAEDICAAIAWVHSEMERRQQLLNKRGVRNIRYLRKLYAENPECEREDGPAPKRLFLFFDELANFLGASANKDLEELKDESRSQLEAIGQLSRAMEINMILAAQKPEAKYVSTQLKQMAELRVCVGPVDEYTSKQILESSHGTRFGEGTPKGRAWAWTSEQGFQVVQIPYLPSATEPAPWDPSLTIVGSRERVRETLVADGWVQMMRANKDGGQDPYWMRVEDDDPDEDSGIAAPDEGPEPGAPPNESELPW